MCTRHPSGLLLGFAASVSSCFARQQGWTSLIQFLQRIVLPALPVQNLQLLQQQQQPVECALC
jgi:hypothetical protein